MSAKIRSLTQEVAGSVPGEGLARERLFQGCAGDRMCREKRVAAGKQPLKRETRGPKAKTGQREGAPIFIQTSHTILAMKKKTKDSKERR